MTAASVRVHKFLDEWAKLNYRTEVIYGLHLGVEDREAVLTVPDLVELLKDSSALNGTQGVTCPKCNGKGASMPMSSQWGSDCDVCNGEGVVTAAPEVGS